MLSRTETLCQSIYLTFSLVIITRVVATSYNVIKNLRFLTQARDSSLVSAKLEDISLTGESPGEGELREREGEPRLGLSRLC